MKRAFALAAACLALAGCSSPPSNYINRDLHSLAILPPTSDVDVDYAPRVLMGFTVKYARARGYRVLLKTEVQKHFESLGISSREVAAIPRGEVAQQLGVDGVVATRILEWDVTEDGYDRVAVEFQIYDQQGELVWDVARRRTKKRGFFASDGLKPDVASMLCERVATACFATLKLAGYDPSGNRN